MVDYSKWDRLELSDDSDIECHPNVDKASFIRWKQRDIHEKRAQRNAEIKGLKIQKEMYTTLTQRVDNMLAHLSKDEVCDKKKRTEWLNAHYDSKEKCQIENDADAPTYNEMIDDLFAQIGEDLKKEGKDVNGDSIIEKVNEHSAKIRKVLKEIDPKLSKLEAEKKEYITSEDYHVGFDSSFINRKGKKDEAPPEKEPADDGWTTKKTEYDDGSSEVYKDQVETVNDVKDDSEQQPSKSLSDLGDMECLPETMTFSQIPVGDFEASGKFVKDHLYIACEQQKDALMMKAFDAQLSGQGDRMKQIVNQALLLQYLDDLFRGAAASHSSQRKDQLVDMFVEKMNDDVSPAHGVFMEDFNKMYEHIVGRCKVLKEEQDHEEPQGVEQIQLKSVDPGTTLSVQIPKKGTKEYDSYIQIPEEMRKALETSSIDEVNKVFATMDVDKAEKLLDLFDASGVIQVQAVLDNEEQFDEMQKKYVDGMEKLDIDEKHGETEKKTEKKAEKKTEEETEKPQPEPSSADIVD